MGQVTYRLVPRLLPRFLRRARPAVTDGALELAVTYQLHELVKQLPPQSQRRAIRHLVEILEENEAQAEAFAAQLAATEADAA